MTAVHEAADRVVAAIRSEVIESTDVDDELLLLTVRVRPDAGLDTAMGLGLHGPRGASYAGGVATMFWTGGVGGITVRVETVTGGTR